MFTPDSVEWIFSSDRDVACPTIILIRYGEIMQIREIGVIRSSFFLFVLKQITNTPSLETEEESALSKV